MCIHDLVRNGHSEGAGKGEAKRFHEFGCSGAFAPDRGELRTQVDMDTSGGKAGSVIGDAEFPEALWTQPDLFFTLPAGGSCRGLAPIDDPGGQFVKKAADRGSVLAHQIDVARRIERDDRYGIWWSDDITGGCTPIGKTDQILLGHQVVPRVDPPSLEDLLSKSHLRLPSVTDQAIVPEGCGSGYPVVPLE